MDYQEAIEHCKEVARKNRKNNVRNTIVIPNHWTSSAHCAEEHEQIAEWLEELKQYKQLGTLEEIRESMQELSLHQYCGEYHCDVCALEERNAKLREYERILALEEVRGAMEKQKAKKPTYDGDGYAQDGTFVWDEWICPKCGSRYGVDYDDYDYCPNCGQRIDWSDEE